MCRYRRILKALTCLLLTGLTLAALPASASADWVGFRNETPGAVVVQITHLVKPRPQNGKPHLILPGNVTWEGVLQAGAKQITIYDAAQPRRILFQGPLIYAGKDLFFAIQVETNPVGVPIPVPGQVKLKLTPAMPPTPPAPLSKP